MVLKMAGCVLAVLVSSSALAADSQLEAAHRCTQIKDSLKRLVCFDQAFASAETPAPAPAPPPVAAAPTPPPAPVPAAAPVPAPPVVAAAPALGDEQVQKPDKQQAEEPRSADARVTALHDLPGQRYRITLANGQVWDQKEYSSLFQVSEGDTVRIVKGALGSYRMARISGGRSGWVDVHRVQ